MTKSVFHFSGDENGKVLFPSNMLLKKSSFSGCYFPKIRVVQLPPKAKEFDRTTLTSFSRAFPGT
jgi:hypothetical protein